MLRKACAKRTFPYEGSCDHQTTGRDDIEGRTGPNCLTKDSHLLTRLHKIRYRHNKNIARDFGIQQTYHLSTIFISVPLLIITPGRWPAQTNDTITFQTGSDNVVQAVLGSGKTNMIYILPGSSSFYSKMARRRSLRRCSLVSYIYVPL